MFRVMCSYPQPRVLKGGLPTLQDAIEFYCDAGLAGQTDEKNYYWTEILCRKHGWSGVVDGGVCQMCDIDNSAQQDFGMDNDQMDFANDYIDAQTQDYNAFMERWNRGLIRPSDVYYHNGAMVVGGDFDDPRYDRATRICCIEAIEYVGQLLGSPNEKHREAWHKRNYAAMLEGLCEVHGQELILVFLKMAGEFERQVEDVMEVGAPKA